MYLSLPETLILFLIKIDVACYVPAKSIQVKIHSLVYRGGKSKMANEFMENNVVETQILDPSTTQAVYVPKVIWLLS